MGDFGPWAMCIGIFLVWPLLMFSIGFYVGRKGVPFRVRIERVHQPAGMSGDGYGVASDV